MKEFKTVGYLTLWGFQSVFLKNETDGWLC